jgi:ParB family transcriptional regulator, chromosome partitioning protein
MTQLPFPEIRTDLQKTSLSRIHLTDDTFSTNFMPDLRALRSSMRELGLLEPVLLRERPEGYQILSGFRRLSVLHELGFGEVESRIIDAKAPDDVKLFAIALHENLTTRGLNTVETALALHKLVHQFKIESHLVIRDYLPLFGLETNAKILSTYLSLAAMEEGVKKYVLQEEVSRSNIRKLASFAHEDRSELIPFLSSMKLGESRLREILTLLEEISRRDQIPMRKVLLKPEIQEAADHQELTPSQKTEKIKRILMTLRYPRMNQLEESFEKRKRQLHLPSGISLCHRPYFESKGIKIELQFMTLEEYRSLLRALSLLPEKEGFRELLDQE